MFFRDMIDIWLRIYCVGSDCVYAKVVTGDVNDESGEEE